MRWPSARWVWNLAFFAGDVWALSGWVLGGGVTMDLALGPPEYAALITVFTGAMVAVNYELIQSVRPAVKFGDVNPEIEECLEYITIRIDTISPTTVRKLTQLQTTLKPFNLTTPAIQPGDPRCVESWFYYLLKLEGCARFRDLKGARELVPPPSPHNIS